MEVKEILCHGDFCFTVDEHILGDHYRSGSDSCTEGGARSQGRRKMRSGANQRGRLQSVITRYLCDRSDCWSRGDGGLNTNVRKCAKLPNTIRPVRISLPRSLADRKPTRCECLEMRPTAERVSLRLLAAVQKLFRAVCPRYLGPEERYPVAPSFVPSPRRRHMVALSDAI